jgi:hypothetical protein
MIIEYIRVPLEISGATMGMVRIRMSEPLHRRVKTCAVYQDKKLPEYIVEVLEECVPREIKFDADLVVKKKPKSERSATGQ